MYRFHQLNSSSWLLLWTQLLHTKKELACAIINKFFWGSEVHDERELSVQWWWWRKVKLSSTQRADVGVAPTGAIHNDTVGRLEFFFFFFFFWKMAIQKIDWLAQFHSTSQSTLRSVWSFIVLFIFKTQVSYRMQVQYVLTTRLLLCM